MGQTPLEGLVIAKRQATLRTHVIWGGYDMKTKLEQLKESTR